MKLPCQFAIRLRDVFGRGILRNTEHGVVVLFEPLSLCSHVRLACAFNL